MRLSICTRFVFLAIPALVLFHSAAFAQTGTTSIRGTITDQSGAVVSGASVTLTSREYALQRMETTTQTGSYEFIALQPGIYNLTIELKGFRKFEQKGLQLLVNNPATLN